MPTAELKKVRHVRFTVPGRPQRKMSRGTCTIKKKDGSVFTRSYKTTETDRYENLVRLAYRDQAGDVPPHNGPVGVSFTAYFPIPTSKPKWWKQAARDKIIPHMVKPDLENVSKAILDGLKTVAFRDDCLMFTESPEKWYSDTPRVEVFIDFYEIERVKQCR